MNNLRKNTFLSNNLPWNLEIISVEGAWDLTNGSREVTVAIIDSGIDFSILELKGSTWVNEQENATNGIDDDNNGYIDDTIGWDFVSDDNAPFEGDNHWHGSYVANWVKTVAPNVTIMDLRILNQFNSFSGIFWPQIVAAINYSINMGADVINFSIWNYGESPLIFHDIINRAISEGVVVVGIVGNTWDATTTKGVLYPGKFPEIIATSSIGANGLRSLFSRKGPDNEICAPGEDLAPLGSIQGEGTSFAAPHVSGCVALMKSVNQSLSPIEIRNILTATTNDKGDPGHDTSYGYGLLNVTNAVRGAAGLKTWNYTLPPITTTTIDNSTSQTTVTSPDDNSSTNTIHNSTTETQTTQTTSFIVLEVICLTLLYLKRRKAN
jgi:subtilisin family serine protease